MKTSIVEEKLPDLLAKVNGHKPAVKPEAKGIGKADIIQLAWRLLYAGMIVAAFLVCFGTFAMLARAALTLFGIR